MGSAEKSFQVRDLRQKQWFIVDDAYLNGFARLLGPYASMVYFTLCRHADSRQLCFPSISLIAEKVGISERQVMRCIRKLQEHNIIRIKKRPRHNANVYHLLDKTQWIRAASSDSQSVVTHSHPSSDSQSLVLVTHSHPKETIRRKQKKETTTKGEALVVLPLESEKDTEEKDAEPTAPDQFTDVRQYLVEYPGLERLYGTEMLLRALTIARRNDPARELSAKNGTGAYLRGICQFGAVLPGDLQQKLEQPPEDPRRAEIREILKPGVELAVEGNTCVVDSASGVVVGRSAIPREMLIDMILAGAAELTNKEETHAN